MKNTIKREQSQNLIEAMPSVSNLREAKKYWLTLFPETFLWCKNNEVLIYNTSTRKSTIIPCYNEVKKLCNELLVPKNLYTINLSHDQVLNNHVSGFVGQIKRIKAGELIEDDGIARKPVSYAPIFKLQRNIEYLKWEHGLGIGGNIIDNLHEITLHINGSKNGNNIFYKQIPYPVNVSETLSIDSIKSFVSGCKGGNLSQINILGDVLAYQEFQHLLEWLLALNFEIQVFILQDDLNLITSFFEELPSQHVRVNLIIHDFSVFPMVKGGNEEILSRVRPVFIVTSASDIETVSGFTEETGLENYDMVALFNGNNLDFFEQYVYLGKEDIEAINLSKREVFTNMALNIHSFGKLTIMPDGNVYANVNNAPVANIYSPIYDLIYKEMTEGQSWLNIRGMKPCSDCIYQWLCPSPGNYEMVIGKPDLCHVRD